MYRDIIGYYLDPDTAPNSLILPQRMLLDKNHTYMIANWIYRGEHHRFNSITSYSFKRLYHASRDGFEASKFHELCDNKGPTIMISKLRKNGNLIGGYNPLNWRPTSSGSSWQYTAQSFLFAFPKKRNEFKIYNKN